MDEPNVRPPWWMNAKLKRRVKIALIILLILLCIALIAILAVKLHSPKKDRVCTTPACIHAASHVLKNMDTKVDPCDNFYKFVCGGFLNNTVIADDAIKSNSFTAIEEKIRERVRVSIEEPIDPMDSKPFETIKNFYKTCMNTSRIESEKLTPLIDVVNKLGGWPVLDGASWKEDTFNWINSTYKFREMGYSVDYFINFVVHVDLLNSTKNIIYLTQASLGLNRASFIQGLNHTIAKAYRSYMVDIAVMLGANRTVAEAELLESLKFEMELAKMSLPMEAFREPKELYHAKNITDLSRDYPTIPWAELFTRIMPASSAKEIDKVVVLTPHYISELEKLMNRTSKRVQANYLMWRAVKTSVSYLTEQLRDREIEFVKSVTGNRETTFRWKRCIDDIAARIPIAFGAFYVRHHVHSEAKGRVTKMVHNIKRQFNLILKNADWMDEDTRKSALDKAADMKDYVAYPEELLDDKLLNELFENFPDTSTSSYLQTNIDIEKFWTDYSFGQLAKPFDPTALKPHDNHAEVDAFYSRSQNSIQVPVGILEGTFFNGDLPRYMNYGGIGMTIGHEITHGYDDLGRLFDKHGNLNNWWKTPETEKKYLDKAQCIVDQYGNYTVESVGMNLNGKNTEGENIADNGGIKIAYLAYKAWAAEHGEEQMLPGLDYNPQQMVWISAANSWCSLWRPQYLKLYIAADDHSTPDYRILGALSNRPEFAEDFKCPVTSRMNPVKKCEVW